MLDPCWYMNRNVAFGKVIVLEMDLLFRLLLPVKKIKRDLPHVLL